MEALYRMESLCSEAFFGRCRRLVRFIALFRSVFRAGTVIPFLDNNMESFAGTILFCQICPLTVRPSPMPDETEQPDRKTACSADLRFRFASCRRVYPPLSRRGAVRRLVPPVRHRSVRSTTTIPAIPKRRRRCFMISDCSKAPTRALRWRNP